MTAAMIARVELGERALTVEELTQLAVVYQVPPACILAPWIPSDADNTRPIVGADFQTTPSDAACYLIENQYPQYPGSIAEFGSALEGRLSLQIFSNRDLLAQLASDPSQSNYKRLINGQIEVFLNDIRSWRDNLKAEVVGLLGFDPFIFLDGFVPSPKVGWWPDQLDEKLAPIPSDKLANASKAIEKLNEDYLNYRHQIVHGYFTDLGYARTDAFDTVENRVQDIFDTLRDLDKIQAAVDFVARKSN